MAKEIKGYQINACFGSGGCPNRITLSTLIVDIENLLKKENLLGFLRNQLKSDLKFHHEFRVSVSDCPNACSQPQIKDIGIIGAKLPRVTDNECNYCLECVKVCKEKAITLEKTMNSPEINFNVCVKCGECINVCPTKKLGIQKQGYRIQLGGKLGRHPRLAKELPEIYTEKEVIEIVSRCISYYKTYSRNGERFADLLIRDDAFYKALTGEFKL